MMIVRRPSPVGDLVSLRQAMDRLFEDSSVRSPFTFDRTTSAPALDVRAGPDAVTVEAVLAGVKPEDVEITVENGTLTIRAESGVEREDRDDDGRYLVREIRRGSWSRTLRLPDGIEADKATADFENGVLRLRLPMAEATKPRQIRITPASNGRSTTVAETSDADGAERPAEA